ncbi:MAG: hypothetical protein R3E12_02960 [Candidatus Eisenbacteria bacterium]
MAKGRNPEKRPSNRIHEVAKRDLNLLRDRFSLEAAERENRAFQDALLRAIDKCARELTDDPLLKRLLPEEYRYLRVVAIDPFRAAMIYDLGERGDGITVIRVVDLEELIP